MATSDILGLFMSPEQYQAQQMAQQQAGEQQRAFNFAGLDPRQQANYGVFLGAQQLGRGFGGLLGVQDPQLQRIRQRQEIMQSINPADPQSLMAGIQRAAQTGDQELALTLTDFMNKQGSEMALAQQRKAQAERAPSVASRVQESARIGAITKQLASLDPDDPENAAEIAELTAERNNLQRNASQKMTEAERNATIVAENTGFAPNTPEYKQAFNEAFNRFVTKDRQPTTVEQLENLYTRLDKATKNAEGINPDPEAVAKNPEVVKVQKLIKQLEKTDKPSISPAAQIVIDQGYEYGTPAFYKALSEELAREKPPAPAPERVRINAEVRKRKDEQKKLKPDSEEYKEIQEDIDFLENKKEGRQPNVSAAVDEIALADFNKPYFDLSPAQRTQVLSKQKEEAKKEKDISYGIDREAIAQEFFEKPFKDLTKEQKVKVNAVKEDREKTVAREGAAKLVLPGQEKPVDVLSFRISARKAVEPYIDTIDNGDNALAALKNARTSDGKTNESSFNQGVAYLAAMAQSGRLSNKDVELVKESPAVLRSLQNYVSTKWEGVPTQTTINGIIDTVRIIRKVAKAKYDREIAAQRKLADLSGMSPTQRDTLFEDMTPGSGRGGDGGGGGGGAKPKTVPFNSLPK